MQDLQSSYLLKRIAINIWFVIKKITNSILFYLYNVLIKDKNGGVFVLTMAACIGNTSVNKLIKSWNWHKMIVNVWSLTGGEINGTQLTFSCSHRPRVKNPTPRFINNSNKGIHQGLEINEHNR